MKDVQQKMREAQKENDELNSKLLKKERECDVKTEEKVSRGHLIWVTDLRCHPSSH